MLHRICLIAAKKKLRGTFIFCSFGTRKPPHKKIKPTHCMSVYYSLCGWRFLVFSYKNA